MVTLNSSYKVYEHLKNHISYEQEEVWIVCLNSQKHPLEIKRLFIGTVDSCTWHPREIFKTVVMSSCSSFIICHSHPGGNPAPSRQDIDATIQLNKLAKLFTIKMDDHIILSANSYYSFTDGK